MSDRPERHVARAGNGVQVLNPIDRALRCADKAIRRLGYPGIETQMLVWLDGRASTAGLRTAIARLSRRYPVLASRLVESDEDDGAPSYWQFRPGAECRLEEAFLPSDHPDAVLDHAAQILSIPQDPTEADPIRFHLLHRPGGRDVLLLQYNHVLMDNKATVLLVRELDRLARGEATPAPSAEPRNPILRHLRRFSRKRRHEAALKAIHLQAHVLRGRATTLHEGPDPAGLAKLRIATRALEAQDTKALQQRVVALCGYPSLSMALLGCAFRAIDRLAPHRQGRPRQFAAGIGMDLFPGGRDMLLFQNLTSVVPLRVPRDDIADRDRAVRLLSAQMRERLAEDIDLGFLRMTALFSRRPRYIDWVVSHLLHFGYSLWYAYFGSLDAVGRELCGAKIEDVFYTGPVWSSIGLTLLANQFGGRLLLQVTYDPRIVAPSLAGEFLDLVVQDLHDLGRVFKLAET